MSQKDESDISDQRPPLGTPSPVTKEQLIHSIGSDERFRDKEERILEWWISTEESGGQPEVQWLSSAGTYRVRSEPDGEWEPVL